MILKIGNRLINTRYILYSAPSLTNQDYWRIFIKDYGDITLTKQEYIELCEKVEGRKNET